MSAPAVAPAAAKSYPCWCCNRPQRKGYREHCGSSGCRRLWVLAYGDAGHPDPDETSIYRERQIEAGSEAVRVLRRDRIVRSYTEGVLSYNAAKEALMEVGCSETVLGAERMIHRTLHSLGIKDGPGMGNRGVL
jgi:hypothetical protein